MPALIALAAGSHVGSPAAAAPSCATAGYLATLGRALAALHALPPDPAAAREALAAPDASPAAVALRPVIADLRRQPPDTAGATRRLEAAAAVLALPPNSVCDADAGPARESLRRVYASRAFADLDAGDRPGLLEQFLDHLFGRSAQVAAGLADLIRLVLALVAAASVLVLLARWRARRRGPEPAPVASAARAEPDPDAEWSAAVAAAARGDHREAVRRAFRSSLLSVTRAGRLAVEPSWTTAQLLTRAAGDDELLSTLAPATGIFDHAWYSGRPVTDAEWVEARRLCGALRRLPRRAQGRAA